MPRTKFVAVVVLVAGVLVAMRASDQAARLRDPKTSGLAVLDGSRTDCAWGKDADALQPGIFGPSRMPVLTRPDYVANSNESYWLANPAQPLTGFPRNVRPARGG